METIRSLIFEPDHYAENVVKKMLWSLSCIALLFLPIKGCEWFQREASDTVELPLMVDQNLHSCTLPCENINAVDLREQTGYQELKNHRNTVALSEVRLRLTSYSGIPRIDAVLFRSITVSLRFDAGYGDTTTYWIGEFNNVYASDLMSREKSFRVISPALTKALRSSPDKARFTLITQYATVGACAISSMTGTLTLAFDLNSSAAY